MRMATGDDGEVESETTLGVSHLADTETGAEIAGVTKGDTTVTMTTTVLIESENDRDRPAREPIGIRIATPRIVGDPAEETTKTAGTEGADHTLVRLHDLAHHTRVPQGTINDANTETALLGTTREVRTEIRTDTNTTKTRSDVLPRQHPTPTLSKPSSARSHHPPNPPYAPKAAAPLNRTPWASRRASHLLMTPA